MKKTKRLVYIVFTVAVVIGLILWARHMILNRPVSTTGQENGAGYLMSFTASSKGGQFLHGSFTRDIRAAGSSKAPVEVRGDYAQSSDVEVQNGYSVLRRTLVWTETALAAGQPYTLKGTSESTTAADSKGAAAYYRISESFTYRGGTGTGSGHAEEVLAKRGDQPVRYGTFSLSFEYGDMNITDNGTYTLSASSTGTDTWTRNVTVTSSSGTKTASISGQENGLTLDAVLASTPVVEMYLTAK